MCSSLITSASIRMLPHECLDSVPNLNRTLPRQHHLPLHHRHGSILHLKQIRLSLFGPLSIRSATEYQRGLLYHPQIVLVRSVEQRTAVITGNSRPGQFGHPSPLGGKANELIIRPTLEVSLHVGSKPERPFQRIVRHVAHRTGVGAVLLGTISRREGIDHFRPRRGRYEHQMRHEVGIARRKLQGDRCQPALRHDDALLLVLLAVVNKVVLCLGNDALLEESFDSLGIREGRALVGSQHNLGGWIPLVVAILQSTAQQVGG
mmetsp:Transcript_5547/g.12050  ORF Transcript_5547/g.12050 Transcript_5547/m.12050 type:complete len:262 (-) Transcript_5547:88-873(-)